MAWFYFIVGGLFEVGFTTCQRYTDCFRNLPWTGAYLVCITLSMLFLDLATRTAIPLDTGYAVWTGIGVLGTAAIGAIGVGEPATPLRILLILGNAMLA